MTAPNDQPSGHSLELQARSDAVLSPKRSRILMAEDDPVSAKILQVALSKFGYEPIAARNGAEAWEIFNQEPVQLIVSDWMMPGLDGLAFCEKVRARAQTPYTYFILLTAIHTSAANFEIASAAGVDDFLVKPLDREAIRMRLRVAERILTYTAQIHQLQELIPICTYCRKVRDEHDYWDLVESYIEKETGSRFSHGACPECYDKEMAPFLTEAPLA
ncbi:MAG TPA: response regulator [Chthoniobacterales bacterium]|nr:response regulator [Chthoniobacterales bacterium]